MIKSQTKFYSTPNNFLLTFRLSANINFTVVSRKITDWQIYQLW